jgi:hypothetical protein
MRITIVALYALIAVPAIASAETPQPVRRTLEASEVTAQLKPYGEDINRCYLDAAADVKGAGKLEITLSIHRSGKLDAIDVATPGLPKKLATRIATCVKTVVEGTSFPARRAPTTAIVPYFYQHTAAPNAGPQLSCWNPKGCKT